VSTMRVTDEGIDAITSAKLWHTVLSRNPTLRKVVVVWESLSVQRRLELAAISEALLEVQMKVKKKSMRSNVD
jgi:hypothetical protein